MILVNQSILVSPLEAASYVFQQTQRSPLLTLLVVSISKVTGL